MALINTLTIKHEVTNPYDVKLFRGRDAERPNSTTKVHTVVFKTRQERSRYGSLVMTNAIF